MALTFNPMIDNVKLTVTKDIANAEIAVEYDINWSGFDHLANLSYNEKWELVGDDSGTTTTIFVGPMPVNGVSSNGNATTHPTKGSTIAWSYLVVVDAP